MMRKLLLACAFTLLFCPKVWAHAFWVNAFESFSHPPGHALITLGFGHTVPLDDLLAGDFGTIGVERFEVITPDGKKIPLPLPSNKRMMPEDVGSGLSVEKGDLGIRKLQFTDKSADGTYQVSAVSKPSFFTQYVDKDGKQRMEMKSMDQVKGADKVISSLKFMSYAKAIFGKKKWTDVKPLGDDLEVIPLADVTDLRVGDLLPVSVNFMGKPLATEGMDIQFVTATSNSFGGPDKFSLMSYLDDKGKAQFRIPAAGEWLVTIYVMRPVAKDPSLADLKDKTQMIIYMATMTVTVKP